MIENLTVEKIKQECMDLLSTKNLFTNHDEEMVGKIIELFKQKPLQTILNSEELLKSASVLLKNNLNITSASRMGYMHRNTLIYRIEKIKRLSGLDLRIFDEAVVFQNLVIFYKYLSEKTE